MIVGGSFFFSRGKDNPYTTKCPSRHKSTVCWMTVKIRFLRRLNFIVFSSTKQRSFKDIWNEMVISISANLWLQISFQTLGIMILRFWRRLVGFFEIPRGSLVEEVRIQGRRDLNNVEWFWQHCITVHISKTVEISHRENSYINESGYFKSVHSAVFWCIYLFLHWKWVNQCPPFFGNNNISKGSRGKFYFPLAVFPEHIWPSEWR